MNFVNMKIRTRFTLLIVLFALGLAACGAWSLKILNGLKGNDPVYQRIIQSKDLIADILPPPEYIIESYLVSIQLSMATEKPEQDKLIARLNALKNDYDTRHDFWTKGNLESQLQDALLKQAHEPALAIYAVIFNELVPGVQKQDKDAASAALTKIHALYATHRNAIDQVVQLTNKRADTDEQTAKQHIEASGWLLLTILAISLGVSVGVALLIMRSIADPLQEAVSIAQTVATGDLTYRIDVRSGDETGQLLQALKEMGESLVRIVSEVRTGTETITDASSQMASGNQDLSSRTEQQASSLEETASSMEELTSTVKQNAENAHQANRLAVTASEVAIKGGAVVSEVVHTMGAINESARKIVDIIGVIDGIAFQTNILALNAAVEAARAGEQGRGFAVVASEVRNLAQRSAAAAKEIKALIGDSVEKVNAGAKLVDQAGATMDEVVASVKHVTDIISEIASASQEQTSGIEQVNVAITQMDQATQQNAALVEQAAAAAEAMQHQAENLSNVVSVFKLAQGPVRTTPVVVALKPPPAPRTGRASQLAVKTRPAQLAPSAAAMRAGADGANWEEF